ncbi:dephospho-CoA kinase [Candidatus Enterovibrio altilux]|uniref:Dephospho-CoA kinase n=1 Tax=Candidatus Enterovibrio altilux TaxID=1927128 RepID=A0A291B7H5_9GAMM|nr:dephospho-CoA kinase [Candidatus Enterovibrio luxaltus]ATF08943.1 Dephospho-CoA kinase [Candidatus Enterovibrio luxaltus]
MALVIGLTGGICSGKTTVANFFKVIDIDIIDADIIARQVVEPGTSGLSAIITKFGDTILDENKTLNRTKLREHIFSNLDDKAWLNAMLHPKIKQEMIMQTQNASLPYCMLVAPLLIENSLQSLCDRILVVDVSEKIQVARIIQRDNVDDIQVKNIFLSQATRKERLLFADDVIKNECNDEELSAKVAILHSKYLTLAEKQR